MLKAKNTKPKLKNIDELFGIIDVDSLSSNKNAIIEVEIEKLIPFEKHPFSLYEGERLNDLVESIKNNGVLVPIIARKLEESLEILAGHNRVNAAKLVGLFTIPAIILENVSNENALIYVVETNLIQRSFADMKHSEKATVIALHHTKLFSQGKRNDIIKQIKHLETPDDINENSTSVEFNKSSDTRKALSTEYGLSINAVALYKRVNELVDVLKVRLDNDEFSLSVAAEISFISDVEQKLVAHCIELNEFKLNMKKASLLRKYSKEGTLDDDNVYLILSGESISKSNSARTLKIKIKSSVYKKYFTSDQSPKEVQATIEKALDMYFSPDDVTKIFHSLPGTLQGGTI